MNRIAFALLACLCLLLSASVLCQPQIPELVIQSRHAAWVNSVSFNPAGNILASGGDDHLVKLWDAATGLEIRTLARHTGSVTSVCFSPDGKIVASGSQDDTVRLWDVFSGRLLKTLAGPPAVASPHAPGGFVSVVFSPDGRTVAGAAQNKIIFWDVASGHKLKTLAVGGMTNQLVINQINSICFSPNGTALASGSNDKTVRLWAVPSGKPLKTLIGHLSPVTAVCFSPNGEVLASGSDDRIIKVWETKSGRVLETFADAKPKFSGDPGTIPALRFSPNGKLLASGRVGLGSDDVIRLWDIGTKKHIRCWSTSPISDYIVSVCFSPDGKTIATGNDTGRADICAISYTKAGRYPFCVIQSHSGFEQYNSEYGMTQSLCFSHNGLLLADKGNLVHLWSAESGQALWSITDAHYYGLDLPPDRVFCFNPNDSLLAADTTHVLKDHSQSQILNLCSVKDGKILQTLSEASNAGSAYFSADGKTLATGGINKISLWDVSSGRRTQILTAPGLAPKGAEYDFTYVCYSPDGNIIAGCSDMGKTTFWSAASGQVLWTLPGFTGSVCTFSPDGKILAVGSKPSETPLKIGEVMSLQTGYNSISLWNVDTRQLIRRLNGHTEQINSLAFNPDSTILASGSADHTIKLWSIPTGKELNTLAGHSSGVVAVSFSPDGKTLASGGDFTSRFWNVSTGKEICRRIAFGEKDWVVITPEGQFDGSPDGLKQLHYVVGLEPIALDQLKERYYEPGLFAKLFGSDKAPLRDVPAFDDVLLYPKVDVDPLTPGAKMLTIHLTNQGGGIGPVQVYVNNQVYKEDARPAGTDPNVPKLTMTVDLTSVPNAHPGQPNAVKVVALNYDPKTKESYLQSRGTEMVWTPRGQAESVPRHLYAIVVGISQYGSDALRLGFAAKDADSFAGALELAAGKLFTPARVHVARLNTTGLHGAAAPTKANIQQAFADVKAQAKPDDILVIYLAGHGIALPAENSLYCYLTSEARTTDTSALNDPAVRAQTAVTSHELADWIKGIAANYRVMVLDTCAAGAAAPQLDLARDLDGDQIRAMDRFQGRTGFHVLMGCASDAVSYEASRYGQGLLTYSLLQGMRGAALRDDLFVDVSKLFTYAQETVPQLVKSENGGIQQPFYPEPEAGSFDIGELDPQARAEIPLEAPKPQLLRPTLFDPTAGRDDLHLSEALRQTLRAQYYTASRGDTSLPIVFVDADSMPGAIQASGTYSVIGSTVSVSLSLFRDDKNAATLPVIQGTREDLPTLIEQLASAVTAATALLK